MTHTNYLHPRRSLEGFSDEEVRARYKAKLDVLNRAKRVPKERLTLQERRIMDLFEEQLSDRLFAQAKLIIASAERIVKE